MNHNCIPCLVYVKAYVPPMNPSNCLCNFSQNQLKVQCEKTFFSNWKFKLNFCYCPMTVWLLEVQNTVHISTECSVTGYKRLWIEHFRCFVMAHRPSWTLHQINFCIILTHLGFTNEQFLCLSWSKFQLWTLPGIVLHKHHTSHPVNTWLKWYSRGNTAY